MTLKQFQTFMMAALAAIAMAFFFSGDSAVAQPLPNACTLRGVSSTLIAIDRTSRYTTNTGESRGLRIGGAVDTLLKTLQGGDRVSIVTIERQRALSALAFNDCYPGCPPGSTTTWPLSSCPEATLEVQRRDFKRRLYRAVAPLLQNDVEQRNSDITGTLHQATQQHRYNRVFIFSDMLENSQILPFASRFSTAPPSENFAIVQQNGLVSKLPGGNVQIVGFGLSHARGRPALTAAQDRNIREFWSLYFRSAGATVSYRTDATP